MKILKTLALFLLLPVPAFAANLTGTGASVHDSAGTERETFTSGETITLRQSVSIAATSASNVTFKFEILNSAGSVLFTHTGNAAPGTAGGAQSQLSGISISSFYSTPGSYSFRATAVLDADTVTQTASFLISSPNITLIYPPYGARDLSDSPLTFRWTASGASRYRVTVADNAGLYNELHSAVNSGESYYSYPESPTEPREQLVPEQVYYWKVEGLDASNNKISESNVYNFSLRGQASAQTRNVAVTRLDLTSPALDYTQALSFRATLSNTGSATESNISVKFTLGGIAGQDSPKQVASIGPGDQTDLYFTAFMPAGQDQALAVACADLFDDNMPDNCKTKLLAPDAGTASAAATGSSLSYDEMFAAILSRLGPDAANALEGYTFETLSCSNCTQSELSQIIEALISGDAQLVSASVEDEGGTGTASSDSSASEEVDLEDSETLELADESSMDISSLREDVPGEWSGFTEQRGKEVSYFVLRSMRQWRKVWNTLSSEEAPDLDFKDYMVVGIISGSGDRSSAVRLLGRRKTDKGLAYDYYQIEAPAGAETPLAAYLFRVQRRSDEKVEFNRLDVKK